MDGPPPIGVPAAPPRDGAQDGKGGRLPQLSPALTASVSEPSADDLTSPSGYGADHQRCTGRVLPPAVSSPSIFVHSSDFDPTVSVSLSSFFARNAPDGA